MKFLDKLAAKRRRDILLKEGYLCPKCKDCMSWEGLFCTCFVGTLATKKIIVRPLKDYTEEEIDTHLTEDPMVIPMRKECVVFREIGKGERYF